MKYITEMTEQEVLVLTDEQLNKMFKLKLAMEGIPLVEKPAEPEYEEIPQPDVTVHTINPTGIMFLEMSDAESVCKVLSDYYSKMKQSTYDFDYNYKYLEPYRGSSYKWEQKESFSISVEQVYSKELTLRIKDRVEGNKLLKEDFEKKEKAYGAMLDSSMWIKDEIWGKWREVTTKYAEFDSMLLKYRSYLELADNDVSTAWKFFRKAHTVTPEGEEYIKKQLGETIDTVVEDTND